jgi:hypothetical protein
MARETLSGCEAELLECIRGLEIELEGTRAVAHEAVHALSDLTRERDRIQRLLYRTRDELKVLVGAERARTDAKRRKELAPC